MRTLRQEAIRRCLHSPLRRPQSMSFAAVEHSIMEDIAPAVAAESVQLELCDAAAAAADLLQIATAAGQLVAVLRRMSFFVGAATNTNRCSCVWCIAV